MKVKKLLIFHASDGGKGKAWGPLKALEKRRAFLFSYFLSFFLFFSVIISWSFLSSPIFYSVYSGPYSL